MKCPKCQSENPNTQKFCGQCGVKLEKVCPKCGSSNHREHGFCGECSHELVFAPAPTHGELSFEEKLDRTQRYLSGGLTENILSQREKSEGERKQVTVMFCDTEGFTPPTERLDPEEVYSIMGDVFETLIHRVDNYGGTVNKMTSDSIMILFRTPTAVEDAPQRGTCSALSIHREMARFSDRIKRERRLPPMKTRIGIHTDPVAVSTLGNDLQVEFTAVGDTVNLASRMQVWEPEVGLRTERCNP